MRYCWYEKKNRITSVIALILLFVMGVYWISCAIKSIVEWHWPMVFSIPIFSAGIIWGLEFLIVIIMQERKYKVEQQGLTIRYPFGIVVNYPWTDFNEIAICKVRYSSRVSEIYSIAIRCVVGEEKHGPKHSKQPNERWSRETYEALHFNRIISIEFSNERYEEFRSACAVPIVDYRNN